MDPSLDALERDPGALTALLPAERLATLERVEVLAARLRVRVLASQGNGAAPPPAPAGERAVRLREAANLLGMSRDSLHRKWRGIPLGGYVDVDGRVKFPLAKLTHYIRTRG
jgi:hypothetical protein